MQSDKKKTPRAVLYPAVVFGVGMLTAILVPILSHRMDPLHGIDPYRFGHAIGGLTFYALILALIVGFISDRGHKKANLKSDKLNSA